MGRKYREFKTALRANPTRSLLVIDDWGLRLKLFSEVESIIKKIDKVERDRDNFSNQDQRLFTDWYDLAFRQEKKEMEDRHQEHLVLARFHNDIIALAEMQEISPHEAYLYLQEEEKHYQEGSEEQRTKIDRFRQERREFAQEAMAEEFGPHFDEENDLEDEDFDSIFKLEPDLSDLDKFETKRYHHFKSSSLEQLKKEFSGGDGLVLALEALGIASLVDDPALFLKIWDALPAKIRRAVSKDFEANTGTPMEEHIQGIRGLFNEEEPESEFIQFPKSHSHKLSDNEERELKTIFRKLVRLIHPDSQDPKLSPKLKSWYDKIWQRVQEASKSKDLHQLKRLEIMALIRLKELNSLTMGEIKASAEWLEEELAETRASLKGLEKHPAWKFSTKRSYESLIKKIRADFQRSIEPLLEEIEELKSIHNFYKQMAKEKKSGPAKKRPSGKKRRQRVKPKNSSQMSFFD